MATKARRSRLLAAVAALVFLHFALDPVVEAWYAKPNLLLCALLMSARQIRPAGAAALGLCLGVLEDAMAVNNFGLTAILLVLLGYAAAQTRDLFLGEEPFFVGTYLFLGTWLYETVAYLLMDANGNVFSYLFLRIPLDALATGVLGYAVLPFVRTR
ncbi:MAG: rod shape-determining protein MreD [Gemmatimonadota bacterium]|nr:MAG: rod shape-determining protein MreD [Gemmatimonadota bacterium]